MPEATKKTKAELLSAREARQAEADRTREAHELLCLELEDRFCSELGPRGVAWQMVNEKNDAEAGPICIKVADAVAHKAWKAKPGLAPEDMSAFLTPTVVYPERGVWLELVNRRPEILTRAVWAQMRLCGAADETAAGKY